MTDDTRINQDDTLANAKNARHLKNPITQITHVVHESDIFLMLSPDLVCARRDRDEVILVVHTSSGRFLLLEGRNITTVLLPQRSVAQSCTYIVRCMLL
jgi:hypothetical protein